MREIVGSCLSQFHNDANSFELLLAYSDGREVGHTVSRAVAQRMAADIIANAGGEYAAKHEEIESIRAQLIRMVDIAEARLAAIHKALMPSAFGVSGIESPEDHVEYMTGVLRDVFNAKETA